MRGEREAGSGPRRQDSTEREKLKITADKKSNENKSKTRMNQLTDYRLTTTQSVGQTETTTTIRENTTTNWERHRQYIQKRVINGSEDTWEHS